MPEWKGAPGATSAFYKMWPVAYTGSMEYDPYCSLCRKDPLAPQPYSDEVCWETVCPLHRQPMIVLNAHRPEPTPGEWEQIRRVKEERHPQLRFRGYMTLMPEHWHDHLILERRFHNASSRGAHREMERQDT